MNGQLSILEPISSSASCLLFVQSQYQRQSIWLGKKAVLFCVGSCLLSAFVFEDDLLYLTHPCWFLKVYRWSKVTLASSAPETLKLTVLFSVFFFLFYVVFRYVQNRVKETHSCCQRISHGHENWIKCEGLWKGINDVITNPSMKEAKFPGVI